MQMTPARVQKHSILPWRFCTRAVCNLQHCINCCNNPWDPNFTWGIPCCNHLFVVVNQMSINVGNTCRTCVRLIRNTRYIIYSSFRYLICSPFYDLTLKLCADHPKTNSLLWTGRGQNTWSGNRSCKTVDYPYRIDCAHVIVPSMSVWITMDGTF